MTAAFVDPVDQRYPVPPDPVRVTEPPVQKVVGPEGVITAVGRAFTVTDWLAVLVQPLELVTVIE